MMVDIYEALQDLSLAIPSSIPAGVTHPGQAKWERAAGTGSKGSFCPELHLIKDG